MAASRTPSSRPPRRTWDAAHRRRALEPDRRQGIPLADANLAVAGRDDGLHPAARRAGLGDLFRHVGLDAQRLQPGPGRQLRPGAVHLSRALPDGPAGLHPARREPPLRAAVPDGHRPERHQRAGAAGRELSQSGLAAGHHRDECSRDLVRRPELAGLRHQRLVRLPGVRPHHLRPARTQRRPDRQGRTHPQPAAAQRHHHSQRALQRVAILAGVGHDAAPGQPGRPRPERPPAAADSSPALAQVAGERMNSLETILRQLRRAAARARAASYAVHGLVAAGAWITAVLVIARLVPFERRAEVAAIGVPVAAALVVLAWSLRRPSAPLLMALADIRLGLKERLSTAWERRAEAGPMDGALRQDALRHAAGASPVRAFPVRVNRGEASLVAVLTIFALGLALLPNPMDRVLAQRQADRASQARAAKVVTDAQKKVAASDKPNPQVEKILQDTQAKIREAASPRKALESITPAEQQLQRLTDPGTPALNSSAQNLANALSGTAAGRGAAQAVSSSPAKGAQAVRDLASQLQTLSPKDREELAKALAKASQQAQNAPMRDSLSKAASSLQSGDTSAAAQSLNDVASQLDSLQAQQNTDQAVASAINGLEAARQELAAQADRDAKGQAANGTAGAP